MKRVCIVGYGAIGPIHAKILKYLDSVELYGICDIDPVRLQQGIDTYGVKGYTCYNQVLFDPEVDCVHICTPHCLHYEMICQALAAGKEVVTEKPVTMTKTQYLSLCEREDAHKVCIVLQNRCNPCVVKLKELISSGSMGKMSGIKGIVTWHRDRGYYEKDAWRGKWETEGGGALINQSIHTLDLMGYLAGDIIAVSAAMCNHTLTDVIEVEDTVTAHLRFGNCVSGVFYATNAYMEDSFPYIEISFEQGLARYMDGKLWINGEMVEEDHKASEGKTYWGTGHAELLRMYYEKNKFISAKDVNNTMLAIFAAYESAANKSQVVYL